MKLQLGPLADAVNAAIHEAVSQQVVKRIWRKDASLWKADSESQKNIRVSLGWLTVANEMIAVVDELEEYGELIRQRGFNHVMVCGMGGSSLCPEVLRRSFGSQLEFPELIVLDSTDPDVIADLTERINVEKCLFIISSKSGSTIEPTVFYKFWYDYLKTRRHDPGDNFIAITDPGSPLVQTASDQNFQRIFINQADIGGRFSALSYFGMLPAAVSGIDIRSLLDRARGAAQMCSPSMPPDANQGLTLGVVLGECAKVGRDKLTLLLDERIGSLNLWIEQLVAESTGKEGNGILPVAGENLGAPQIYGSDRIFVSISIGEPDATLTQQLQSLMEAGHPVVQRTLKDVLDLGAEFFIWEFATACAGWCLGINPFDQPDVQLAKEATNQVLKAFEQDAQLPTRKLVAEDQFFSIFADDESNVPIDGGSAETVLRNHLSRLGEGDYFAVLAYLEETDEVERLMQELQRLVRDKTSCAATVGYGPRYLHSTGQLHKGGPDKGVFLQIIANDATDFLIPGEAYSFSVLKQAQASGDFRALTSMARRVLGVDIGNNGVSALKRLLEILAS